MKKQPTTRISKLVESFVSQLEDAIQESALDMVRKAVEDAAAPSAQTEVKRSRKTATPAKRSGGKSRNEDITNRSVQRTSNAEKHASEGDTSEGSESDRYALDDGEQRRTREAIATIGKAILVHIQEHPGERIDQIAQAFGGPTKALKLPIAKLVSTGQIRSEGQQRGTKYFPISKSKKEA